MNIGVNFNHKIKPIPMADASANGVFHEKLMSTTSTPNNTEI